MTLGEWIRSNAVNAAGVENLIELLDPARLRRRPRRAVVALRPLVRRLLGQRDRQPGTFSPQLRHRERRPGAPLRRRLAAGAAAAGRPARRPRRPARAGATGSSSRPPGATCTPTAAPSRAKRVVVAAPAAAGARHRLVPAAAADAARSCCAHLDMGQLMKCDAVYETPFWREAGLNGFGINDSGAARAVFDNSPERRRARRAARVRRRRRPGATYGTDVAAQRRQARARGLRGDVRRRRRCTRSSTSSTTGPRSAGPRGGPIAIHAPGDDGAVRAGRSARRSAGCTGPAPRPSTYWSGYMDGAVRAGERACRTRCCAASARLPAMSALAGLVDKGLMAPDWAAALAPVDDRIAAMGRFLREEVAAGRRTCRRATRCSAPSSGRWPRYGCWSSDRTRTRRPATRSACRSPSTRTSGRSRAA